jgi:mono/diheme cytochrome c family protein
MRQALPPLIVAALFLAACPEPDPEVLEDVAYHPQVETIVNKHCVSCHTEDGIAPFPLETYEQVSGIAQIVDTVVQSRQMPPWNVDSSGDCNRFDDERWLSDEEMATIAAWVEQGAPEGDSADVGEPPVVAPELEAVDITMQLPEYTPDAQSDDYRCFVLDTGLTQDRYMRGFNVKPGDKRIVHHVILYALDASDALTVADLDNADPGPGYTCFGGPGTGGQDVLFGWAPGSPATTLPDGVGLRLLAGVPLVAQVHYSPAPGATSDSTTIELDVAGAVEREAFMTIEAGPTGQMSLQPGNEEEIFDYSFDVEADVTVWGAFPHMHTLGRSMTVSLAGFGAEACMVDVPRWDFDWQQGYFFQQPIDVEQGAQVNVECRYDTRSRDVVTRFGERTQDEMCVVLFYYSLR